MNRSTRSSETLPGSAGFTIALLLVLAVTSLLMACGVQTDIRGLLFPWYTIMLIVVLFQVSIIIFSRTRIISVSHHRYLKNVEF